MKLFADKAFLQLQEEWRDRLAQDGFVDHEDRKQRLKSYDRRTIAWENRDRIRDFFLSLDNFMRCYPEMPDFDKRVMVMYAEGTAFNQIVREVRASRRTVWICINRYIGLVNAMNRVNELGILFPLLIEPTREQGNGNR